MKVKDVPFCLQYVASSNQTSSPDTRQLRIVGIIHIHPTKRLASLLAPSVAPRVIIVHYQISSLFEMLDLDTCLTPSAENQTRSIPTL